MNTVLSQAISIVDNQTIDFIDNSTVVVEPVKSIQTGELKRHIRVSSSFYVVESVLWGFAKKFLDGVQVFTSDGCLVKSIFSIRNNEYTSTASQTIVSKAIKEYLHSKANIETSWTSNVLALYDEKLQEIVFTAIKQSNISS